MDSFRIINQTLLVKVFQTSFTRSQNLFLIAVIALFLLPCNEIQANESINNKGLFTIQFSWNEDSFSKNHSVSVEYKKIGFLTKAKHSGNLVFPAPKNDFITMEMAEGEYELLSFKIQGESIPYGKVLMVPVNKTFSIEQGQITNGGLFFIGKEEKKSSTVYSMKLDNTGDVKRYLKTYKPEYISRLESMSPAWKFIDNDKLDGIISAYADVLVARETKSARPKVKYLYATLGIMIKMEKDAEGIVLSHQLLASPTYQQISSMKILDDKVLCKLPNGDFLYGKENDIQFIPMPQGLEKEPEIYVINNNRFLLVDDYVNIFSSDENFNWKHQSEHRSNRADVMYRFHPELYRGPSNLYFYTIGSGANKLLLRASYEDLQFTTVALSKDIKKIPMVTETSSQLIIGPVMKSGASAKKPAYLYVRNNSGDNWEEVELPRGDCNRFSPYRDNDSLYYIECGLDRIPFKSSDSGKTWNALDESTSKR